MCWSVILPTDHKKSAQNLKLMLNVEKLLIMAHPAIATSFHPLELVTTKFFFKARVLNLGSVNP